MHAIFPEIIGPRGCRHFPAMTAPCTVFAIQLDGYVHGRLTIVKLHLAATHSRWDHPKIERPNVLARLDQKNRRHLKSADPSGSLLQVPVALHADRVRPGRDLGERELPLVIGDLGQ